ncbi:chromate transporter [Patescibacteria group bacterium]|nr:chromate transporter [Patescibacteria group bacterium]
MILLKLFAIFFKIGLFTVGGGYAMIPFIQKEAVEINKWLTKKDFLEIVALDAVTPGPIAVNLATFVGYKVSGIPGAIIATIGVVLPSLILVTIIATFFYAFRTNKIIQAILNGLKPAVIALIAAAIFSLLQGKAIFDIKGVIIALIVFVGVVVFKIHPMWLVILSGLAGFILYMK